MTNSIRVAAYRVEQPPEIIDLENDLPALQKFVGGYLEPIVLGVGPDFKILLLCNEDGRRLKLPPNRRIGSTTIVGDFFVCRQQGAEFVSIKEADIAYLAALISAPVGPLC